MPALDRDDNETLIESAAIKAIAVNYERRRPIEKVFEDWIARCKAQLDAALTDLEGMLRSWPSSDRLMQTDITTVCMYGYVRRVEPTALPRGRFPALDGLNNRCESDDAFVACPENGARPAMPA